MTLADRARQAADAAPRHQSAAVLRECADEIDRLRADLAALRAVVQELPWYMPWMVDLKSLDAANAALAAAKKMAGGRVMWTIDHDDHGYPCAIVNGDLRLHIVPGTVKNAESLPVVVALLNRAEAAEAKVAELEAMVAHALRGE